MASLDEVIKEHKKICSEARDLIAKKGHDYNREQQDSGDTLFNLRVAHLVGIVNNPCVGILVRLSDKFQRLNSLTKDPTVNPEVKGEAVRDTIRDIINYSIYLGIFYNEIRKGIDNGGEYMKIDYRLGGVKE